MAEATHNTGFSDWCWVRFSVMTSGDVIVCASSPSVVRSQKRTASGWENLSSITRCSHDVLAHTEVLKIDDKDMLAVSCRDCLMIRLHNLETGETSVAFHSAEHSPRQMCRGEPGQLFVVCGDQSNGQAEMSVLLLDCSTPTFTLVKVFLFGVEMYNSSMCYIPGGVLVVADAYGLMAAMSVDTGEQLWGLSIQIKGQRFCPCRVVYSPTQDALFVTGDERHSHKNEHNYQILMLNPGDGSTRQVVHLDQFWRRYILDLCLQNDQLLLLHRSQAPSQVQISCVTLQ